jgi:hypothetical protein
LGREFFVLNVYGPHQDRANFWEALMRKSFLNNHDIILGGDLNFSMGEVESWGERSWPDPLSNFFSHVIAGRGLVDLAPLKLTPTWKKKGWERTISQKYWTIFFWQDISWSLP